MCARHLPGLGHLHSTPTKPSPQPPEAAAPAHGAEKTPPNGTANVTAHAPVPAWIEK